MLRCPELAKVCGILTEVNPDRGSVYTSLIPIGMAESWLENEVHMIEEF